MNRNPKSAEEALALMMEGNKRFMQGTLTQYGLAARRKELASGQHPFATVVACSDSRVDPVKMFDADLGEIFAIESAGNIMDDIAIGSIEYGVGHLHTPVLMVLAHEKCGAVTACCSGGHAGGHIDSIMEKIRPSLVGTDVEASADSNARAVKKYLLEKSEEVRKLAGEGKLKIVVAKYMLESGEVKILE